MHLDDIFVSNHSYLSTIIRVTVVTDVVRVQRYTHYSENNEKQVVQSFVIKYVGLG